MLPVFRLLSSYYRAPSAPWSSRKSGVAFPHVAASRSLWSTLMEEVTIITGAVNAWSGQRSSTGVTLSSQYAYMWHWRRPSIHIMEPHTERIPHTSHLGATQQGHGSSHYASLQYSVSAGASLRTQWQGNRTACMPLWEHTGPHTCGHGTSKHSSRSALSTALFGECCCVL